MDRLKALWTDANKQANDRLAALKGWKILIRESLLITWNQPITKITHAFLRAVKMHDF